MPIAHLNLPRRRCKVARDFRQEILDRLKRLGKTRYWLMKQVKGDLSQNTVYNFLHKDPKKKTDIKLSHLERLLDELDAEERRQQK